MRCLFAWVFTLCEKVLLLEMNKVCAASWFETRCEVDEAYTAGENENELPKRDEGDGGKKE